MESSCDSLYYELVMKEASVSVHNSLKASHLRPFPLLSLSPFTQFHFHPLVEWRVSLFGAARSRPADGQRERSRLLRQ